MGGTLKYSNIWAGIGQGQNLNLYGKTPLPFQNSMLLFKQARQAVHGRKIKGGFRHGTFTR